MSIVRENALKDWIKKVEHELHALRRNADNLSFGSKEDKENQLKIERKRILKEEIENELLREERKLEPKSNG